MEEPFRYKGSLLFVVKKFASFVIRFTPIYHHRFIHLFQALNRVRFYCDYAYNA